MSDRDEELADFIIVGSGAGAVCAALLLKDAGMKAMILEKQDKVGGSTGYSGGVAWIPNNPLMTRDGVTDSYERARQYLDAAVWYEGPGSSPARREAFLKAGPAMVEYLQRKGMRFKRVEGYSDYYDDLPGGEPRGRCLIAEIFDINELGTWKGRLSIFKGAPMPMGLDELNDLFCVKRTWKGKWMALRLVGRLLYQKLAGKDFRGAGAALQGRLLQIALREGLEIRTETPVEDFIVENGCVVGVVTRSQGRRVSIRARNGVLINAGGFSHNAEMRQKFGRQPASTRWTSSNPGDTGEVLQAAMALGAATDCLDEAWWMATSVAPDGTFPEGAVASDGTPVPFFHHFDIALPHVILVDQNGKRFANEAGSYMELGQRLYENHQLTGKGLPAWAIIDSRHRERYAWGAVFGKSPKSWFDKGYMKQADTLDELATKCGIDAAGLQRTVARFNGFCQTGVDDDFKKGGKAFDRYHGDPTVKPNPNLGTIAKPPFYAVAIYPGDVGTSGGLVTDENGRVLRKNGSIIPGLYATGNCTASVVGRTYTGAGASIGASMVFAYCAARHAASTGRQ